MPYTDNGLADAKKRRAIARTYQGRRRVSVDAIADGAGVRQSTVYRVLHAEGVPLRGRPGKSLRGVPTKTILAAVAAGSQRSAAAALGVSHRTLLDWLASHGQYEPVATGAKAMASAYRRGADVYTIARAHGVSPRTVLRRLRAAEVEVRPRGRRS
jgi:transposase-like protein